MLKLTNSFYRYLAFTCEKVNKAHVRRYSHLNCKRKTCGTECVDIKLTAQFHSSLQLRQHGHGKKRLKIKTSLNANECKKYKPMGDPLQPSSNHASHGGQFQVTATGGGSHPNFLQTYTGTATAAEDKDAPQNRASTYRVWETVGCHRDTDNQGPAVQFKVLSYNLLAQYLLECHPYLYMDHSPIDLTWDARAERLFDEITTIAPDILCLQEVQTTHLDNFFAKFEEIGYTKIFKKKTGFRHDGCAIYFKTSMFELIDHITVELNQPELPILNRDNVGIVVKLLPIELPCTPVVIATTHLLYNPKRADVRLAQMQVMLAEIDRFAFFDDGRASGHHPIILTGDFNSTRESAVIKLLDRGKVRATKYRQGSDWKNLAVTDNCQHLAVFLDRQEGRQTSFENLKIFNSDHFPDGALSRMMQVPPPVEQYSTMFNGPKIGHSLRLRSVYDSYGATTFQDYWVTVDYIYFSRRSSLRLVERLRLPSEAECKLLGRIPNHIFGSDHLALVALFELKPYRFTL